MLVVMKEVALLLSLSAIFSGAAVAQSSKESSQPHARDIAAFKDERAPIALSDVERAFLLREMRGFLVGVQEILDASGAGDKARVATAARRVGMNGPENDHIPRSLAPKLPMAFKQLGLATHRGFDELAAQVEKDGVAGAPKQLGALLQNCVACDAGWRIVDKSKH